MIIFSVRELFNFVVLIAVIGYILSAYIHKPRSPHEYLYTRRFGFNWDDFKFACLVAAPAIVLHELAHKFVAMAFGLPAFFEIFWGGLGIAVILKLVHSPILIIAPGYVVIPAIATPLQNVLISVVGPLTNLILWIGSSLILKRAKHLSRNQAVGLYLSKKINMILFIFNILPFPPLDGYHMLRGLTSMIF